LPPIFRIAACSGLSIIGTISFVQLDACTEEIVLVRNEARCRVASRKVKKWALPVEVAICYSKVPIEMVVISKPFVTASPGTGTCVERFLDKG